MMGEKARMVEYSYLVWYGCEMYEVRVCEGGGNVIVSVSAKNYSLEYSLDEGRLTICLGDFVYVVTDADEISDFLDDVETLLTKGKILHEEASKILNVTPIFKGEER